MFSGISTIRGYEARYVSKIAPMIYDASDDFSVIASKPNKIIKCNSNISLMRSVSLCMFTSEEMMIDCEITHPSVLNIHCTIIYSLILRLLIRGNTVEQIFNYIEKYPQHMDITLIINHVNNNVILDLNTEPKRVTHGMYCALYTLKQLKINDNYQELMLTIIKMGGCIHINLAISCAVIGAYLGHTKLCNDENFSTNLKIILNADSALGNLK